MISSLWRAGKNWLASVVLKDMVAVVDELRMREAVILKYCELYETTVSDREMLAIELLYITKDIEAMQALADEVSRYPFRAYLRYRPSTAWRALEPEQKIRRERAARVTAEMIAAVGQDEEKLIRATMKAYRSSAARAVMHWDDVARHMRYRV